LPGEKFVDVGVAQEEVENAAVVGEVFGDGGQGLIVAGVAAEVRAADDAVADFELHEGLGDFEAAADQAPSAIASTHRGFVNVVVLKPFADTVLFGFRWSGCLRR
jgi:hypothetical protein